jgi:hypothetical protein
MYFADAVLSGGIRRTASSVVFELDDEEMMAAKTYFVIDKMRDSYDSETDIHHMRLWINKHYYDVDLNMNDSFDGFSYNKLKEDKTIGWKYIQPQRGRSNNSVLLLKNKVTKEQFESIIQKTRQFGEPGFVWADHPHALYNPCLTEDSVITTSDGLQSIETLIGKPFIALVDGQVYNSTKQGFYHTGSKNVIELTFKSGRKLKVTPNHKLMTTRGWKEAKDISSKDQVIINNHRPHLKTTNNSDSNDNALYAQGYCLGGFLGDGNYSKNSAELKWWGGQCIESKKDAIMLLETAGWGNSRQRVSSDTLTVPEKTVLCSKKLFQFAVKKQCINAQGKNKRLSKEALNGRWDYLAGIVAGYFDADGTVAVNFKKGCSLRICSVQLENLENLQIILNAFGIYSKIYNNRLSEGYRELPDGKGGTDYYLCQTSHELVISQDSIQQFYKYIHIRNQDKKEKLQKIVDGYQRQPNRTHFIDKLVAVVQVGIQDVYDCTIDRIHAFDANGVYVHNCYEVGFLPVTKNGECGVQFCNLTTSNGDKVKTLEDFVECVTAQVIIAALQAGYTNFPYLSKAAKELTEEEALMGLSITGVLNAPEILLDDTYLKETAQIAVEMNKEWAKKLGINPAARTTLLKPEGTGSLAIGVQAPGIHAAHGKVFFRRVQATKGEPVFEFFKKHNPHMCEESVWSVDKTDEVIIFPLRLSRENAIVKDDIGAIEHLEIIKKMQQHWVIPGGVNNKKPVTNNVSCTVVVKKEEWQVVIDYIFENRQYFAAVSFLDYSGDKTYQQAPLEKIVDEKDWKLYNSLLENYQEVDFTSMDEQSDLTMPMAESSCVGGACMI